MGSFVVGLGREDLVAFEPKFQISGQLQAIAFVVDDDELNYASRTANYK